MRTAVPRSDANQKECVLEQTADFVASFACSLLAFLFGNNRAPPSVTAGLATPSAA